MTSKNPPSSLKNKRKASSHATPPLSKTKKPKSTVPAPEDLLKQQIIALFQRDNHPLKKSQIAEQLHLKGSDRLILKGLLKTMIHEAHLEKEERHRVSLKRDFPLQPSSPEIPQILSVEVSDIDEDGSYWATPLDWDEIVQGHPPKIRLVDLKESYREGRSVLGLNSRLAIKITAQENPSEWTGVIIRRIARDKMSHLGIFHATPHGGTLSSVNRKDGFSGIHIAQKECKGLEEGDIVQYILEHANHPKIIKKLGHVEDPHIFSEMAIHTNNLPHTFSPQAIALAEKGKIPALGKRTDYRHLDLVTIDGEDARDFDDAVWAAPDEDPQNQGGWRALVAIADVSYYVRPDSALDQEAYERGNSVYFPDRVVPMLPEALSNELCSLKPHVDRACMVIEMILTKNGRLKSFWVKRGLMRSRARLTYGQVQRAIEGNFDEVTKELNENVIVPLYGAFQSLLKARHQRGTLEIEMPERQILFDGKGKVSDIVLRERFESHKLIEEFMIAANVAAAKTLEAKKYPCLFRVHDTPDRMRIANLREFLKQYKLKVPKTDTPSPAQFNDILYQAKDKPFERMINDLILRSQSQAKYSPDNLGHFGLNLSHYAHFTSPIRRYSDLVVHRYLITALNLGNDGYDKKDTTSLEHLREIGDHLSKTERTAASAEREVVDRFAISFVSQHVGDIFNVVITGVNRAGLFVQVPSCGAEGFVPKGTLGLPALPSENESHAGRGSRGRQRSWGASSDFYFDEANHRMIGRKSRLTYQLGDQIKAVLYDADTTTNSMTFRVLPSSGTKKDFEEKSQGKSHERGKRGGVNSFLEKKNFSKKSFSKGPKKTKNRGKPKGR